MSTLADQLKAALEFDELRARELAPHFAASVLASGKHDFSSTESTIRFGYIHGRERERARTAAIDQALCEVVEFLERNAPRFYGETEVALEALFDRLRAALEGRG